MTICASADVATAEPTFETQVMPLADDLFRRARMYTGNTADAEDLVQETLLKAYRAFHTFGQDRHLKAWLLRIMRNTWINNYRAGLSRPTEALVGDVSDGYLDTVPRRAQHESSAEHLALLGFADEDLLSAVLELPEKLRLTLYYVVIVGLSHREVSAVMKVPAGTVMSRMHRGRLMLRKSLSVAAAA
ncbi:sigma-70 family RNA polymerase sigma factor [Mycolicibacterium tokaiense]|uniref:RNA polymerase sigma factor n=1 Tax=Mycolicibacterium tokaiense TaxID=39695 RepID=A0A378T8I0_9MYCO|nr:sigma-70 family RNA polymerase sigma factor [Mycolicibacterium tokaiense]BBY88354.1 RNA polymerase sigma factor [Mycolicibacterium tokaiense]STZ57121.1 ECF subfamily RNA polymerase sigma-70 factor [Mycolicibacterium tokaiense]